MAEADDAVVAVIAVAGMAVAATVGTVAPGVVARLTLGMRALGVLTLALRPVGLGAISLGTIALRTICLGTGAAVALGTAFLPFGAVPGRSGLVAGRRGRGGFHRRGLSLDPIRARLGAAAAATAARGTLAALGTRRVGRRHDLGGGIEGLHGRVLAVHRHRARPA
ncbi:MAG: hypothetical protein JWQ29_1262, partial [Phenylobacterium sp.]|nr:hypothetical protein [Phenylobacterium sp.]